MSVETIRTVMKRTIGGETMPVTYEEIEISESDGVGTWGQNFETIAEPNG